MKKLLFVALVAILLPVTANAALVTFEGDAGLFWGFDGGVIDVIKGETRCFGIAPTNFGFVAGNPCPNEDTFCVHVEDDLGWAVTSEIDGCFTLGAGNYMPGYEVCITVPCEATIGMTNTFYTVHAYCDVEEVCQPDSGDCIDPSMYGGNPYYQHSEQDLIVVESPPALYILQDTLYFVEQGQTAAYVPFAICNGDPCAPPTNFDYMITSIGHVGDPLDQSDTAVGVLGGACQDVYGIVNAGSATPCDYDTLTIVVWFQDGSFYDTCVQAIHVVEPVPVPLFTAPVVTILVLAMILAAAVIMKRHAVSKA